MLKASKIANITLVYSNTDNGFSLTFLWRPCFLHGFHLSTDQVLFTLCERIKHLREIPHRNNRLYCLLVYIPGLLIDTANS